MKFVMMEFLGIGTHKILRSNIEIGRYCTFLFSSADLSVLQTYSSWHRFFFNPRLTDNKLLRDLFQCPI